MSENKDLWNSRWGNQFKNFNSFEEISSSMGIVVKDLLKEIKKTIVYSKISNMKVADIGGGYGSILNFLIGSSNEKHLIEISESAIKIAKDAYNLGNTHIIDLTEQAYSENDYFDFVLCNEVVEHIHPLKIDAFLSNINHLIKPGGKIMISTPNIRSMTSFFLMLFGWNPLIYKMDNTHICPFTPKELNIAMEKNGFKKVQLYTTKCLLFKTEKFYIHFPFRWNFGEHIIGVWEK
jgi:2-polyprenyl-3-methyl-5-hydroxy-6-metoxy-1,4-benzoquinol methylase